MLENQGCSVMVAVNGEEAVQLFAQSIFDLVLMDMQMPIMGGEEAAARIRLCPRGPTTPIVAFTAHAMKGDRERYLLAGLDGYISKPFNRQEFFHVIANLAPQATRHTANTEVLLTRQSRSAVAANDAP
jgi:CheY-like chemotaxis protein